MTHDYAALKAELVNLKERADGGEWVNLTDALVGNLPAILAALEAAQQVQTLQAEKTKAYETLAANQRATNPMRDRIPIVEKKLASSERQMEKLTKALDWIRGYIDSHSHKHFVEFTNDNPKLKAWRAEVDRLLAKEALSAIEDAK